MKLWAIAAACAAIIIPVVPHVAVAQGVWGGPGACGVTPVQTGLGANMVVDSTTGNLCTAPSGGGTGTGAQQVQGTSAAGTADDGSNPVKVGAVFMNTLPVYTNGQRGNLQMDASGNLRSTIVAGQVTTSRAGLSSSVGLPVQGNSPTVANLLGTQNYLWNGTTNDGATDIVGAIAAGTGNTAVDLAPTSAATAGNVPTATAAVGSNLIVKGTPGNLYSWVVTSGASAGYVMIFNATTLPADGAVTPTDCRVIAANSTIGSGNYDIPERYTTGIVIGFSTTGCFTKTASATAYIRATFQ